MHILVVTRIMPSHSLGGMQKQTMDLCSGFVKAGHKVTVITTSRLDGLESEEAEGVEILYLKGCKPGYYSRKWNSLCRMKIKQIHQDNPIDVIHSQSMGAISVIRWAKPPMAALTMHGLISDMRILFTSIELQSMKNTEIKE